MRKIYLKNLNASIYIDSADVVNEKDFDGKIRVYDSRKEYLDYIEEIFLYFDGEEKFCSLQKGYERVINELANVDTIEELLGILCVDNVEIISKDQVEMGDDVNYIGEYALLFY